MSFNGSGTFVINSSGQPVVTNTTISSTVFNAFTADISTGLSTAVCKDGQTATTARIPFAQGISSTLATNATSITTGSIVTAGGISAEKALWVGGLGNIAGGLTVGNNSVITGTLGVTYPASTLSGVTFGTGSTTQQGWIFGTLSSAVSGIWSTADTPSTSNYKYWADAANTIVNAPTTVYLSVGNVNILSATSTGSTITGLLTVTYPINTKTGVTFGTGSSTQQGWIFGNIASGTSGIWSTGVTPSGSNFAFWADANNTIVNAPTTAYVAVGNSAIGTFTASGLAVTGALSKSSGSFRIEHPLPDLSATHELVHSFIEGPKADLIYRGRVALVNGAAMIKIDAAAGMTEGTFEVLCRDVQCFTSNETDWHHVRGLVNGNILTIECEDNTSVAMISWMVIGERKDRHMYDTDWTDDDGHVIVEPLKPPAINLESAIEK